MKPAGLSQYEYLSETFIPFESLRSLSLSSSSRPGPGPGASAGAGPGVRRFAGRCVGRGSGRVIDIVIEIDVTLRLSLTACDTL